MPMRAEVTAAGYRAGLATTNAHAKLARGFRDPGLQIVLVFAIAGLVASAALLHAFPILADVASALAQLS